MLQTDYAFTLPLGYEDEQGDLHRSGTMRMATAADEILPLKDPRVRDNPAYLVVILLSRVITTLGSLEHINPKTIEGLFAPDLAYLQDFYNRITTRGSPRQAVACPHCRQEFEVESDRLGGIVGYPLAQLYEEVAFIAAHFHWPYEQLMSFEHSERRLWVEEINHMNRFVAERSGRADMLRG